MRPRISVGAVWAELEAEPDVVEAVRAEMTIKDPDSRYKRWGDGTISFVRRGPRATEFLAGFAWRVAAAIRRAGHGRPEMAWPAQNARQPLAPALEGMEWRPYQIEALQKAARATRLALQVPTRGGKTEIGIEFARQAGGRGLWVTHLDELKRQTPARFRARMPSVPVHVVGEDEDHGAPVTVGMVQAISKWARPAVGRRPNPAYDPAWFAQFDWLVVDEAHHAGAETWQAVCAACVNATLRLGLSGTMSTGSQKSDLLIEGALGPTHVVSTTAELAEQGYVARPRVVVLRCAPTTYPSYEEVREAVCPDWREDPQRIIGSSGARLFRFAYERGLMENERRNALVVNTAVRHADAGDRFLVLCNRVPHARAIAAAVQRRTRAQVWALDGGADPDTRKAVLTLFKNATAGAVLVCTPFFREGVDLPQVDSGFMAGGGESDIAVWQGLSRMLTKREGKDSVVVYDVLDGREQAHEKDYLANHWKSRLALYKSQDCEVIYQ